MIAHALLAMALMSGAVLNEIFDEATAAYSAGDYAAAVNQYEVLVSQNVVSPAVFYNLGNAYYRGGRLGPAIANYERCLQLDSGFDNAASNLQQCVALTKRGLARPLPPAWERSLLFWHYDISAGTTRVAASLFWILLWAVLGLRQWRPLPYTRHAVAALAVLALAFGGSAWAKAHPAQLAVANSERVPVHYGMDEAETVHFELYAGDRVLVDTREQGWLRVRTADGKRGWARDAEFTLVGPPYERPAEVAATSSIENNKAG